MNSAHSEAIDWNTAKSLVEKCLRARRVFDESMVDDLVQETLLRAYKAMLREAPRSVEAFLSDLAAKTLIDHVRSRSRWAKRFVPAGVDFESIAPAIAPVYDDAPLDEESIRALLARLFARFAPECSMLLEDRLAGLEWDAIAERTGRRSAALRQSWKRGLDKVRGAIESGDVLDVPQRLRLSA